ncbi:MAG: amidohydrolase family protein [Candidatus Korobacteraceae bacterium]
MTGNTQFVNHGATGASRAGSAPASTLPRPAAAQRGLRADRQVVIGGRRILTVDAHAHVLVPEVWELVKDRVKTEGRSGDRQQAMQLEDPAKLSANIYAVERRLNDLDDMRLDMQVVHINPFWYWADRALAEKIVEIQNEKICAFRTAYPDRFVGLGSVALQFPSLAAEQMEAGMKKQGFRGFAIAGSVNGEELSSPKFYPFWAKAEELQALIFIHPQGLSGTGDRPTPEEQPRFQGNGRLGNVIGHPLETTLALTHLIQDGTLDRFPKLIICAAHGGGYLPSYSSRSDQCLVAWPQDCKPLKKRPTEYLKQLYYDSILFSHEDVRHLIAVVGASQVVIGTDYPTMWNRTPVDRILGQPGLSDEQRIAILSGTVAKLLKLNVTIASPAKS